MEPLVAIEDLQVCFDDAGSTVHAVNDVSLSIGRGETLALVGESGSGKSVTAMSLARLLPEPPARYPSGRIRVDGQDVLGGRFPDGIRGAKVAYIFQDPGTSLNPYLTVGYQLCEAVYLHRPDAPSRQTALELLDAVGITGGDERLGCYPHQLSGGMQQRVMIAMALACRPLLLVADEPTTALDVTTQGQILALLRKLQQEHGMAVLLITHNLGIVAGVADRVCVMYAGRIVEVGDVAEVLRNPMHPYTAGLIKAVPQLGAASAQTEGIPGSVPDPRHPSVGCAFAPRCPRATEDCLAAQPTRTKRTQTQHVCCIHPLGPGEQITFEGAST